MEWKVDFVGSKQNSAGNEIVEQATIKNSETGKTADLVSYPCLLEYFKDLEEEEKKRDVIYKTRSKRTTVYGEHIGRIALLHELQHDISNKCDAIQWKCKNFTQERICSINFHGSKSYHPESTQEFENLIEEIMLVRAKKNADYGNAFMKFYDNYGSAGIMADIGRKYLRIENYCKKQQLQVEDESVEDTFKDLAVMCLNIVVWMRSKRKEEKLK